MLIWWVAWPIVDKTEKFYRDIVSWWCVIVCLKFFTYLIVASLFSLRLCKENSLFVYVVVAFSFIPCLCDAYVCLAIFFCFNNLFIANVFCLFLLPQRTRSFGQTYLLFIQLTTLVTAYQCQKKAIKKIPRKHTVEKKSYRRLCFAKYQNGTVKVAESRPTWKEAKEAKQINNKKAKFLSPED